MTLGNIPFEFSMTKIEFGVWSLVFGFNGSLLLGLLGVESSRSIQSSSTLEQQFWPAICCGIVKS